MTKFEYLLTCLSEECAEVIQRVTKIQRFGYEEIEDGQFETNVERLAHELDDVSAIAELLIGEGLKIHFTDASRNRIYQKKLKVTKWMEHSRKQGTLSE